MWTLLAALLLAQIPGAREPVRMPPEIVPDLSRDIVKLAPRQYAVEMENNEVRVLRVKLAPGEEVPVHDARQGVVVALTQAHVRLVRPDQRTHYVDLDPGQTQWVYEDSYATRNLSNKPVEFLFIELRGKRLSR